MPDDGTTVVHDVIRGDTTFANVHQDYGTVEAHCRVGTGPVTVVPYTLVPGPAAEAAPPIPAQGQ